MANQADPLHQKSCRPRTRTDSETNSTTREFLVRSEPPQIFSSNCAFDNERIRNQCCRERVDLDDRLRGRRQAVTGDATSTVRFLFRLNNFTGSPSCVHRTSTLGILASLLRHARLLQNCPELVRHGFMSEGLVVLVVDLSFKSGNRIEFLHLCSSETCQMCETQHA